MSAVNGAKWTKHLEGSGRIQTSWFHYPDVKFKGIEVLSVNLAD